LYCLIATAGNVGRIDPSHRSRKLNLVLPRIKLKQDRQVFTLRSPFVMPRLVGSTSALHILIKKYLTCYTDYHMIAFVSCFLVRIVGISSAGLYPE
jgi:hypothetical protein